MKYIDLIILVSFLTIFSMFFTSSIKIYGELEKRNGELASKVNEYNFIYESFCKTCEGEGFESLIEWQKKCKAMWNLDYIGWSDFSSYCWDEYEDENLMGEKISGNEINDSISTRVLNINKSDGKKIFYGYWVSKNGDGEVYWEVGAR